MSDHNINVNIKISGLEQLLKYFASVLGPRWARKAAQTRADVVRIEAAGDADALQKLAQAQANAKSLIQEAKNEAEKEFSDGETLVPGTVSQRKEIESSVSFQEEKRRGNIASVIGLAAENLDDVQVQEHDVDHDWMAQYFRHIQEVTSEHMQHIWAKILAGEVEMPGRTSLHTLAILKKMSRQDAILFENSSRFVFDGCVVHNYAYNLTGGGLFELMHLEEIQGYPTMGEMLQLASYGLFSASHGISKRYVLNNKGQHTIS